MSDGVFPEFLSLTSLFNATTREGEKQNKTKQNKTKKTTLSERKRPRMQKVNKQQIFNIQKLLISTENKSDRTGRL